MRLRSTSSPAATGPRALPGASAHGTMKPVRRSVSRLAYLALLGLAALVVLRWIGGALTYAEAPGIVDGGEAAVGVERTGTTERVFVTAGQTVRRGQPLAEVSVLAERTAAEGARTEARRLRAEAEAEVDRAAAQARVRSADALSEAARLRDDALRARAEAGQADREMVGLRRQVAELDEEIAAREELQRQGILARSALVDLRVRRHELLGRREGLRVRRDLLTQNAAQLQEATARLEQEARDAPEEELKASRLAALKARAAQLDQEALRHEELARHALVAPADGEVAWVESRPGEVVQAGRAVITVVPFSAPIVVAWPGEALASFPVGARVVVRGEGFDTTGTVERVLVADRAKPRTLLRPYEAEVVEAALLVRVDAAGAESVRAGSVVSVRRPRMDWLERWLIPLPAEPAEQLARR